MALADPDLIAQLPRASFSGIEFPYTKCVVKGALRHHIHEYPKAHGGAPEKLGRKLYTISFHGIFDAALLPPWNQNGNSLWPGAISDLFDAFEEGATSDLMIPSVGKIKAVCTTWSRELEAKRRSGETADLEFLEDQSQAFLVNGLVDVRAKDLSSNQQSLSIALADAPLDPKEKSLFDKILAGIATVVALVVIADTISEILTTKVEGLINLFELADSSVPYLDSADALLLLTAFLECWNATLVLLQDLKRKQSVPILPYLAYADMSVVDVAADLYGDTSRAVEIMQLNALEDPLRIRKGTMLRVYAPTDSGFVTAA